MHGHHAWLTYASSLEASSIPQTYKVPTIDVEHIKRDRFSIDDARELISRAQQKPFQEPHRVFVLVCDDIAQEAQNALLKLFEEPPLQALFYVIIPSTVSLIPTLRSRVALLASDTEVHPTEEFVQFLQSSLSDRLALVALKTKDKDRQWIESIVAGCEVTASSQKDAVLMERVLFVRKYLRSKGASLKMLLEDLSLVLPLK